MTDTPHRPRKRSAAAGLTAAGALAMLSACDGTPQQQQQDFGPKTEVAAFATVDECKASGEFAQVTCEEAAKKASGEDGKAAPRFDSKDLCEDQFGGGQCLARNDGGQSFFVPLLTGFMIGRMLNGGGYSYNPLYRNNRDRSWYTPSGAWLTGGGYGGRGYNYQVGSRAVTAPITTQRVQTRSSVVSRGGFGGRVSARSSGGWGGGRSFGG